MDETKEPSVPVLDPSLYTGATSDVVKSWMKMLDEGKLTPAYLKEFLSTKIPELYAMVSSGSSLRRFELVGPPTSVIGCLEEFIYNGDKEMVNEFLVKTGRAAATCGKGFKNGEPSYNCRECSTDHTCVLCVECFQNSPHRFHKYRMATSTGGGYCDCGDKEAWKSHPYCDTHQPSTESSDPAMLPSDMHRRTKLVFSTVLNFSHEVLNKFYSADLRVQRPSSNEQKYLLLMYNDEIHSFDQVINLLVKVIKCSGRQGLELASKINKEGRAVIADSDYETCSKMKSKIESMSTIGVTKFLEVHIVPFHVVAVQCFALHHAMEWLKTLLKTSHGFRSALIDVFEECDVGTVPLLDKILVQDPLLWKYARMQWNSLLCSGFLPDYDSKKSLAVRYLANYPKIMENYLKDEEDHTYSVAGLSVQLFSVPSIAQELIYRYGALESIIDFIIRVSTNDRNDRRPGYPMTFPRLSERASFLLYDVRYLLCSPPSSSWTCELRQGFCKGMSSFFDFLGLIEGMDDYPRLLGAHMEFEPDWERAFNLQLKCFPVISQSLEWCKLDYQASMTLFNTAIEKHKHSWKKIWGDDVNWVKIGTNFNVRCMAFDASKNGVSIHLPLTRFWGALFFVCLTRTNLADLVKDVPVLDLMEPVMRTRAMIAQFRAGMWRKNGQAMSSSVFFYHNNTFRMKTLDMDVKLLQIGASLIDSNDFLMNLIYKFGLLKWSQLGDGDTEDLPETDTNQLWSLVDEFLHLIIVLTAERCQMGVGDVTFSDCVKHELIHELASKPKSHSELSKALGPQPENYLQLEDLLAEIATFKSASETSACGHYELKDVYHPNFNVFFYHFNKEISFKSEQVQKERHKTLNGLECCPPPTLPSFAEPFSKVINLLNCDVMIHVMKLVLGSWTNETTHNTLDGLHKILFLFGLALLEEETENGFSYTVKAKESKIVEIALRIYCSHRLKEHRDLMKWTLLKYGKLTNDETVAAMIMEYDAKEEAAKQMRSEAKLKAQQARVKIMDNMKLMQMKFSQYYQEPDDDQGNVATLKTEKSFVCILCQEEESVSMEGKAMVYIALVQLSTVHARDRQPLSPEDLSEIFLLSKMGPAAFMSTCGHVMHAECWEGWRLDAERRSSDRQPPYSHDPSKNEFLCPLCQCISNIAIPILPSNLLERLNTDESSEYKFTFVQWLEIILKLLRVKDISSKKLTPESKNKLTQREAQLADDQSWIVPTSVAITSPNQETPLFQPIDEVGYNFPFDSKWMLNIGRLLHFKSIELEPDWFEVPDDKLNWVHFMGSEVHKVATMSQKNVQAVSWDCTMVWKSLAYTVHSIETCLRYEGKLLFALSPREEACLTNLIRISYALSVHKKPRALRMGSNQWALTLLNMIIKHEGHSKCLLDWDCFGVLVALLIVTPNLVAGSSEMMPSMESFLLRLMLISKIAQIMITIDIGKYKTDSPKMTSETSCLPFLMSLLRHECIVFDAEAIWEEIKERVRPFLRCCAIFFHFKCPERFADSDLLRGDTFENLATYLNLPSSFKDLLDDDLTISMFIPWGEHPTVRRFCSSDKATQEFDRYMKEIGTIRINSLVKLPQDYSELLNRVRDFSCPNAEINDSQNPTMCLICGKILCSLSYCCQTTLNKRKVGACTFHAYECGGGTGIFLRIRECQLILFAGFGRGCYHPPPYLDEHHEPDQGLRRGNRLLLSEERYRRLELAWINHGLFDQVTRAIEMGRAGFGMWELF